MAEWHDQTPEWAKLFGGFLFGLSHRDFSASTTGVAVTAMWLANHYGRQADGSGIVTGPGGVLTPNELQSYANSTRIQTEKALGSLQTATTIEIGSGGEVTFPLLRKWQENPSAARVRRHRATTTPERYSNKKKPGKQKQKIEAEDRSRSRDKSKRSSSALTTAKPRVPPSDIDTVVSHYKTFHPRSKPGANERKLIAARMSAPENWTVVELCRAIDGCHQSAYHCGQNERGQKYQSLELIVRDSKHVTSFLEHSERAPEEELESELTRHNRAVLESVFGDDAEPGKGLFE